jgi:hypothetical protein
MKSDGPSLIDQISKSAESGDPFWLKAKEHACSIQISRIKYCDKLNQFLKLNENHYKPDANECFTNSIQLAYGIKGGDPKYIEGLARTSRGIFYHAWIKYSGRYFDPTFEQGAIDNNIQDDWRPYVQYVKLLEIPAAVWMEAVESKSSEEDSIPALPCADFFWGIQGKIPQDLFDPEESKFADSMISSVP